VRVFVHATQIVSPLSSAVNAVSDFSWSIGFGSVKNRDFGSVSVRGAVIPALTEWHFALVWPRLGEAELKSYNGPQTTESMSIKTMGGQTEDRMGRGWVSSSHGCHGQRQNVGTARSVRVVRQVRRDCTLWMPEGFENEACVPRGARNHLDPHARIVTYIF